MIRVKNQKAVAKLSKRSLRANRVRNLVAVFAVALTSMLFMALFTIFGTMVHSFQQSSFRQVGSSDHGAFKDLTLEQKEILEKDPMVKESGGRLMLGMGSGDAFLKVHAEFSFMEPAYQERGFCMPEHGNTPKEGTKEIACDTRILKCVGTEPEIGAEVTVTYEIGGVDKTEITDTFRLSGWWEYDPANMASMAILPKSYVEEILKEYPTDMEDRSNLTGKWQLSVFLGSSMHIEEDFRKILQNNGYQDEDASADNYIDIGVNWAYVGAQLAANSEPGMLVGVAAMLMLIIFTGYLVIYNIFQISVSGDIRFYGLLKTIGTTARQIKRIVRRQALLLSAAGIPAGLAAGCLAGTVLAPIVLSTYNVGKTYQILSPWFFIAAAAFSLITVLLSCAKPGRIASKVSPVEAVRYTDAAAGRKRHKKGKSGGSPSRMALANLGRNKKKTVIVVISMALAVGLFQLTFSFTKGFDMDKYLQKWVVSDFILGNAAYFRGNHSYIMPSVPEEDIGSIENGGKLTESGRIYGHSAGISTSVTEDALRQFYEGWMGEAELDEMIEAMGGLDDSGKISDQVDVYGMEDYPLSQLNVIDGDLADVYDPAKNAVAAVYMTDDYEKPIERSQWAKVGDTVTFHYVIWEYTDDETGAVIPTEDLVAYSGEYTAREKYSADITYAVAACVTVKNAMSYRTYGSFQYVLNAEVFQRDSHTSDVLAYLFNTTPDTNAAMQSYLEQYTDSESPYLDFESKQGYVQEFNEFRNMFLLMGSALSFVVGLVGILNFFNAVLTSIHSRRREFAMLQSIGMTGRQLKKMLIYEGLIYGALAVAVSLGLSLVLIPVAGNAISGMFWFFTYRFTLIPVLSVIPVFAVLGSLLPLLCYRNVAKQTVVERLRENE